MENFPHNDTPNDDLEALYVKKAGTPGLEDLEVKLKTLMASWEYAYAMGHGCSVGDHPQHSAVRERVTDLRALINELKD